MIKYKNNQYVRIHSLGDDLEGYGYIKGVLADNIHPNFCVYIVMMDPERNPWEKIMRGFECITFPNSCLDKANLPDKTCACGDTLIPYYKESECCDECAIKTHYYTFDGTCLLCEDCFNKYCCGG